MDYEGYKILIAGLGDGDRNTALEVRTFFTHLIQSIYLPGDVKEVDCTNEYLQANFDATGLGLNEREGWAICNGLNGTRPRGGRTSIGYSDTYSILGATGGSATHRLSVAELPAHDHDVPYNNNNAGGSGAQRTLDNGGDSTDYNKTKKTGGNQPHNNMQPYLVSLFIQKL